MAELKTKETAASVDAFVDSVAPAQREDTKVILKMMAAATHVQPKMWGAAIVGFGFVHLKYDSGRELDWFQVGFSPRKQNLTLYGLGTTMGKHPDLLAKLGKYTTGKGCLYIKKLSDVDQGVLEELIKKSL